MSRFNTTLFCDVRPAVDRCNCLKNWNSRKKVSSGKSRHFPCIIKLKYVLGDITAFRHLKAACLPCLARVLKRASPFSSTSIAKVAQFWVRIKMTVTTDSQSALGTTDEAPVMTLWSRLHGWFDSPRETFRKYKVTTS